MNTYFNFSLPKGYDQFYRRLRETRLDAAGLIFLAPLQSIAKRTAITGSASWLDILILAPGIHTQQSAEELNDGEYPATAALTSGYVFRVENQATARWLQTIGKPGHLTRVAVLAKKGKTFPPVIYTGSLSSFLYLLGPMASLMVTVDAILLGDWWALVVLAMLTFARFCNVLVIRRRSVLGWKGAKEPGVDGDLLILGSQDKWIRMGGSVDDLKAVTSGCWLRDKTDFEDLIVNFATLLVYLAAALVVNVSTAGHLSILCSLFFEAAVLELSNLTAEHFQMFGRVMRVTRKPVAYRRRTDLVKELIKETGRDDWAIGLGMISKSAEEGGRPAVL
ncbi:MAG: hypothetical protein MMC33_007759 [Icmadophila ericetorum]|nr:hypothetical protein [Icmadophila ericetorum]